MIWHGTKYPVRSRMWRSAPAHVFRGIWRRSLFPARLEPAGAKEVISAVGAVLTENGFTAIDFAEISRTAACALVEKCYAGPEFIRESLPHALYLNEPCGISAMLCGQDHVRLRCIRPGLAVRDAYAGVSGVEGQLDARFDLAFDERLGYSTHDPGELGTGLCVSVLLFLPALEAAGQTGLLAARLERQGLTLHRALAGSARQEEIPLYRLSNRICFGLSEADILSLISGCAGRIRNPNATGAVPSAVTISSARPTAYIAPPAFCDTPAFSRCSNASAVSPTSGSALRWDCSRHPGRVADRSAVRYPARFALARLRSARFRRFQP